MNDDRGWEHFPHGADIGVCGWGPTLDAAFEEAGRALSAAVTTAHIAPTTSVDIVCEAKSAELLFVEWQNAIIYEMAERRMLFGEFEVHIRGSSLRGTVCGEAIDPVHHQPACEPKGAKACKLELAEIERRRKRFLGERKPLDPGGRVSIVIDDGIATGATVKAALRVLKQRKPKRIVLAVPVAASDTVEMLRGEADEIVCLETPNDLGAIGFFYRNFRQLEDDDVARYLAKAGARTPAEQGTHSSGATTADYTRKV